MLQLLDYYDFYDYYNCYVMVENGLLQLLRYSRKPSYLTPNYLLVMGSIDENWNQYSIRYSDILPKIIITNFTSRSSSPNCRT